MHDAEYEVSKVSDTVSTTDRGVLTHGNDAITGDRVIEVKTGLDLDTSSRRRSRAAQAAMMYAATSALATVALSNPYGSSGLPAQVREWDNGYGRNAHQRNHPNQSYNTRNSKCLNERAKKKAAAKSRKRNKCK